MNLDCNEVIPSRLWVGSFLEPQDITELSKGLITTVICLQTEEDFDRCGVQLRDLLSAYEAAGIELRHSPVPDFDKESLTVRLAACVDVLDETLKPPWTRVYLHCTAGINRSPTVAAAYLIRSRRISAKEAYDFIVSRRYCSPYLDLLEGYSDFLKLHSEP